MMHHLLVIALFYLMASFAGENINHRQLGAGL